ncbi:Histidine kinase [hydrothermal vent metagenome]|uniref:histidine kinase n=1 Tax=hydrothermal vent metagenome TaxID=652676 RepID=A0A3B0W1R6_9ZZZZ
MNSGIWHFLKQYGWITLISSVLMISLVIMSQIVQNASSFADTYSSLLFFTIAGIGVLLFVLFKTLWMLKAQYQKKMPGIKITIRLTLVSTLMIGIPTAIIFYFSLMFIHQGINQWFDVKTETALENASALVRMTLDNSTRDRLNLTLATVSEKGILLASSPVIEVNRLRSLLDAQEVALYHSNQQLIAFSSQDATATLPEVPGDNLFQQIRQKKTYAAVETRPGLMSEGQFIRVIIPFSDLGFSGVYALQVIFLIPQSMTDLAESVATATAQYKEISYLKGPLITSFTLILSMVLLLTLVTAVLFTIQAVQNFTRPIRTLARGTRAVSKGDYSVKMPIKENDEFGDLTQSFNDMIQRISQARNEIKLGHQQTEVQKLYLQAIIKNLTSGVLTLDMNLRIRTSNDVAKDIFDIDFALYTGQHFEQLIQCDENLPQLVEFFTQISPLLKQGGKPWHLQYEFSSQYGQQILMVHGSTLPSMDKKIGGYVIVVDDITELVQAQLNAAWSDVARRLAHEIKNPLTPIQLSAERLQFKLENKLESSDKALLKRMTHTIIEQVTTMKTLVQAFSDYAKTPDVLLEETDINQLITDIAVMYQDPVSNWTLTLDLMKDCPMIMADKARLRQLFHNLIKNAIEATENVPNPKVEITTVCDSQEQLIVNVLDNGVGIADDAKNWIFEPYATDKPKGTGLGLAIVRKIVEEHHGQISLNSTSGANTCFIIKFPVIMTAINHPNFKVNA